MSLAFLWLTCNMHRVNLLSLVIRRISFFLLWHNISKRLGEDTLNACIRRVVCGL
jgi:hypothetical protein